MTNIELPKGKKVYFASDNHLGAPTMEESKVRELKFVRWLDTIKADAGVIFLMGDLFDFWFEYKTVIPKGFTRTLGKLAELSDAGISLHYFVGNHDLWMNGYFEEELNIPVYHTPHQYKINGVSFFVGHGDGLGPHDNGYKRMKKLFTNPVAKWFFKWLHPDIGVRLAQYFSVKNKLISGDDDAKYLGDDKEWLVQYALRKLEKQHYDHFIFGHRHLPLEIKLSDTSTYTNLGDWVNFYTYAEFDGAQLSLKKLE